MPINTLAYQPEHFLTRCGATPAFPWAGSRLLVRSTVPQDRHALWWQRSVELLQALASQHALLHPWLLQAEAATGDVYGSQEPLVLGWRALGRCMGLTDYPLQLERVSDSQLALQTACPYSPWVRASLSLTVSWMNEGAAALEKGPLSLGPAQVQAWVRSLTQLQALLPPTPVMALHHRLWRQGITWEWLGEDRTRIGEGARQRSVRGAAESLSLSDPGQWQVPIYTVTGSVGKTTTVRLLSQLLAHTGARLGVTASDGIWVDGKQVVHGDCIGGKAAQAVLRHQAVDAAVFEQGRGGLLNQGVPYARSAVAVLLNVQAVHLNLQGIDSLDEMADVKALGLKPASCVVLNWDDEQCRRLGGLRTPGACAWFSVTAPGQRLQALSAGSAAAFGVARDGRGAPEALQVYQAGVCVRRLDLQGVAPYHGMLGEKTLEELLAAVAAAWLGPLRLPDWGLALRALRLDSSNHVFRTSVHQRGNVVFVLDKAAEEASLASLEQAVALIAEREGVTHRVAVLTRSAGEPLQRHVESCVCLYRYMDEFVCFDRPDTYTTAHALPIYAPGSLPGLLRQELAKLNAAHGQEKAVFEAGDWTEAERCVRQILAGRQGKVLVLINQPATAVPQLNQQILDFVNHFGEVRSND